MNDTLVSAVSTGSTFAASGTTPNYLTLGNCQTGCGCNAGAIGAPGPFQGVIDDWRIYSRELTTSDVCILCTDT